MLGDSRIRATGYFTVTVKQAPRQPLVNRMGSEMRIGAILAGLLALTACAAGPSPAPAMSDQGQLVCITERPLGSNLPRRTCRTRDQIEADRKAAQKALQQNRTAPSVAPDTNQ